MAAKGISAAGCPAIGEGRLGTEGEAPKVPAARRGDIARASVLFLLCVLVYEFSSGAHAYSVDEITNYASARALVESGTPDLRFEHPFPPEQLLTVRHPESGRLTGRYGLLSWLPMVPLYALASATGPGAEPPGPVFPQPSQVLPLVVLLYNPIVAALLVAITFLLGRELGLRPGYAVAAALILAIGSPLWVYAKTLANMPAATTFAVAAILAAARARDGGRAWPAMSGVLAALAGLVRPEFVVLAVVAAPLALTSTDSCVRTRAGRLLTWTLAWAIVAVPGIGLWNLYRTGSFFDTGYGATTILWQTERAYIGVLGILGSPSFGLFVLVPVTALGVWGLLTARRYRSLWITMAGLVALAIVGYGSFRDWFGGVSWGSRYLLSVMPLLALGAAAILQDRRVALCVSDSRSRNQKRFRGRQFRFNSPSRSLPSCNSPTRMTALAAHGSSWQGAPRRFPPGRRSQAIRPGRHVDELDAVRCHKRSAGDFGPRPPFQGFRSAHVSGTTHHSWLVNRRTHLAQQRRRSPCGRAFRCRGLSGSGCGPRDQAGGECGRNVTPSQMDRAVDLGGRRLCRLARPRSRRSLGELPHRCWGVWTRTTAPTIARSVAGDRVGSPTLSSHHP